MKSGGERTHQNNGINQIIEFIRENALSQQIGGKPVITSKGERFLQAFRETAARPSLGLPGAN
jgi:predicted transcriptional regulator